ncbi:winged helix-turn-helix domain-containing protein [Luteibacter yeojuensis]|uniref:Winged helix-turn-helix domain-containing protein n=2 Tax=Luteibacter yeojuensis TaxID=345309 RepID=A0A7X5QS07_9GAMM|nr:winged helix-turn-helix domain-containing protein [Luteibacter yeojuensis]
MQARRGWAPDHGITTPLPLGQKLRGTSTLVDKRTGETVLQWIKSSEDAEEQAEAMQAAIAAMGEKIPREKPRRAPAVCNTDLLNCYVLTDYHLGMLAWGEETGADWDLGIAEDMLVDWFAAAMAQSPAAEVGVFAQLGDFLHWDGMDAVTPTSKHLLDADTRFQKLVRVAIRAIRRVIGLLLEKHQRVHVLMAEGNHDMASSIWLREWLRAIYENEPRVHVDVSPDPYYCVEHGKTALFFHHGHKKRPAQIDTVFAAKFREVFGRTEHAYAHMGHLHHIDVKETNLMLVEQHRTLAAPDAHASRGGWLSGRDAQVITYSRRFGEVGRVRVSAKMLEAA